MTGLLNLKQSKVVRAFERLGWKTARQGGRHIIMTHPQNPVPLVIPRHAEIAPGTMRSLLRDAGLELEEFLAAYS